MTKIWKRIKFHMMHIMKLSEIFKELQNQEEKIGIFPYFLIFSKPIIQERKKRKKRIKFRIE
jgi:hypothetical protein